MKKVNFLVIVGLLFIINGCKPSKSLVDTSCSGYKSASFNRSDIQHKGIAILPVLGGDEKEQFRRPMGNRLFDHMSIEFGLSNVRSTQQVIRTLNEQNLAEDYSRALKNYQHSGIIPGELIKNVGDVLEVEFLLYTRLLARSEYDFVYTGQTHERVDIDELFVQTQIWCTKIGDVVWEGKGGIAHLKRVQTDIVDLTAKGLVNVLGSQTNSGPCENPRALIQHVQQARNKSYFAITLASLIFTFIIIYS